MRAEGEPAGPGNDLQGAERLIDSASLVCGKDFFQLKKFLTKSIGRL